MKCEGWNTKKLSDLCDLVAGFAFKSTDFGEYSQKVIKIADIVPPSVSSANLNGVDATHYSSEKLKKYIVNSGDYVLAMTGATIGKMGKVLFDGAMINQRVLTFRPHTGKIDARYLYYCLRSKDFQRHITNYIDSETAQPNISATSIGMYNVSYPSPLEQKSIADTLSCLDEKIELNSRMNKTLEELAQAIFKSWFVDFEPFQGGEFVDSELGPIPKDFKVRALGEYANVKSGFPFKSAWWQDGGVPVLKIKNIIEDGMDFSDLSYVSQEHAALASNYTVTCGDMLIAMTGATIGKFSIFPFYGENFLVNQRVGKFALGEQPLERIGFLYCCLKQSNAKEHIAGRGIGSAQPNISSSDIQSMEIVLPSEEQLGKFNAAVQPLFEKMMANTRESIALGVMRDSLLPKFMSGEIRVPMEVE